MILYYHSVESNALRAFSRCTNYRELMSLISVDIVLYYKKFTLKFLNLPLAVFVNFLYLTISFFFPRCISSFFWRSFTLRGYYLFFIT